MAVTFESLLYVDVNHDFINDIQKLPGEKLHVDFDFSPKLGFGETISLCQFGAVNVETNEIGIVGGFSYELNVNSLRITATETGTPADTHIDIFIEGGWLGEIYKISLRVTTSFNNTIEHDLLVRIESGLIEVMNVKRQFFEQQNIIENDFSNELGVNEFIDTSIAAVARVSKLSTREIVFDEGFLATIISGSIARVQMVPITPITSYPNEPLLLEIQVATITPILFNNFNSSNTFIKQVALTQEEI